MSSQGLFHLTHDSFVPATDRLEPLLWIQEVVLLRKPNANEVIRTVPFHRGLNVIRTEERLPGESKVVAHSVGKTLLMRLIRYTLGEDNYADSETQTDLAQALPEGQVVAHWRVNSNDWIVIRPLHDHSQKAARCMRSSEWLQLVGDDAKAVSMKEFLEEIEIAVFRDLPSFESAKGHSPRWIDVLGWLARDCECGYRQANEWRHADTNLGKPADLSDNSLLLQWICGLMSVEECRLRKEHWQTLGAGNRAKHQMERLQRNLDSFRDNLADEVKKVQLEAEQQETEFSLNPPSVITFADPVEKRAKQLNELHEDIKKQSGLAELEQREVSIGLELVAAAKSLAILETTLALKTTHRNNLRASNRDPSILSKCPDPCKLRDQLQRDRTAGKDNAEESHLVSLSQEINEASNELRSCRANHERIETELTNVREKIERTRTELEVSVGRLNQSIGNWNSYVAEAMRMDKLTGEIKEQSKIWQDMETRKSASSSDQDNLRSKLDSLSNIGVFSNYYAQILQRIFGDHAQGKIQVDGNGLQPRPDRKLAPRGRAMSAMATVVAFDLAAIMLSLSGRGNHPRFLLHDSPREGEMEMPLFSKVFEVACQIESYFNGKPGFQYIIATANAPSDYSVQSEKHECLVLNGRYDDGRLFKLKF